MVCFFNLSISVLPASAFENLNSLETLNIQNNKLSRISEEVMEPIIDTLRVVDIVGKLLSLQLNKVFTVSWKKKNRRKLYNWMMSTANSIKLMWFFLWLLDNPLICSCDLIWFPELLQSLKDRDDEMTQKKRPMCLMQNEHREYFVQSMPLERMNCVGKRLVNSQLNSAANTTRVMILLSLLSMISLYFWADWWYTTN